jgi:prepilin-type N-terminal cleavage/methylation domain-containing protein
MYDARQERIIVESERGFSLIEVLISMVVTLIVMAAVFGLLTKGQRSFQREPEVADLQQSARTALDLVTKDILQAGAGLPPEFPAFSRLGSGAGDAAPTDVLEIIGAFQSAGNVVLEAEAVDSFDLGTLIVTLREPTTNLRMDDPATTAIDEGMVLLYNNLPNLDPAGTGREPQWLLASVTAVTQTPATVTLDPNAYNALYSKCPNPGEANPAALILPHTFAWNGGVGQMPMITHVSVVRYFTQPDPSPMFAGPPPQILFRDRDFRNEPQAVGYLEDFQVRYVIGITAPLEQDNPPDPATDLPNTVLTAENMLASVRISISARSVTAGLEGASDGALVGDRQDDFIRKTFSTNVNPRNMSAGIDIRTLTAPPPAP